MKQPSVKPLISNFLAGQFRSAWCHALAHCRKSAAVAEQLINIVNAGRSQAVAPYFTHTHLATCRFVQFRGTSRYQTTAGEDLGFIKIKRAYQRFTRNGVAHMVMVHRVSICWKRVLEYVREHHLCALKPNPDAIARPRTCVDYEKDRAEHWRRKQAAEKAAAVSDAERKKNEEAERLRVANTPEGKAHRLRFSLSMAETSLMLANRVGIASRISQATARIAELKAQISSLAI